jgi:hypothetical protein
MSFAAIFSGQDKSPESWFAEDVHEAHDGKAGHPLTADGTCPHCQQPIPDESHLPSMFHGGFQLLATSIQVILVALVRFIRFGIAAALCLVSQLGSACRFVAMHVVHPSDRKLLMRLLFQADPPTR